MQLTGDQINEFQRLYRNRFGKEISQEDAYDQGIKLLQLMKHIYQPVTKKEHKRYKSEINEYENEKREKNLNVPKN